MNRFLILVMLLVVASFGLAQAEQTVNFESVTNIWDDTTLKAGNTHVFSFRIINDSLITYNTANGIRVFSTDGATFGTVTGAWLNNFQANFASAFINYFSQDGSGADTVGFAGVAFGMGGVLGLPAGYNDLAMSVTIATVVEDDGKHICIDSTYFPPGGVWKWAPLTPPGHVAVYPNWSGQKCYVVAIASDVGDGNGANLPTQFALHQNYPNPFNPTTHIKFDLPKLSEVKLTVFNILGQEVVTLVDRPMAANYYDITWDGTNAGSGVYFYRLEAGDYVKTQKMMLLK